MFAIVVTMPEGATPIVAGPFRGAEFAEGVAARINARAEREEPGVAASLVECVSADDIEGEVFG